MYDSTCIPPAHLISISMSPLALPLRERSRRIFRRTHAVFGQLGGNGVQRACFPSAAAGLTEPSTRRGVQEVIRVQRSTTRLGASGSSLHLFTFVWTYYAASRYDCIQKTWQRCMQGPLQHHAQSTHETWQRLQGAPYRTVRALAKQLRIPWRKATSTCQTAIGKTKICRGIRRGR
jgi:hypothetical protein